MIGRCFHMIPHMIAADATDHAAANYRRLAC